MLVYSIVKVHISFHNFGYFVIFNPDFKHEFTCHFPRIPCIFIKLPFLYQSTGTVQQADTLGSSERVLTAAGCGSSSGPLLTLPSSPALFQPSLRPHTITGRVPRPHLVSLRSVLSSSYPSGPCTLKPNRIPERAIRTFAFTLGKHCYSRLQDSCT